MAWTKSSPELVATFDAVFPADPRVERRAMFGYPCAFVNGHMAFGLHQESFIVRLDDADRAELLARPGAHVFEPMAGRTMREYVVAPPKLVADREAMGRWLARSVEYLASLPAKPQKAAQPKKAPAKKGPPAKKAMAKKSPPAKKAAATKTPAKAKRAS